MIKCSQCGHGEQLVKLRRFEQALAKIMSPAPTRSTLLSWIASGELKAVQIGRGKNFYVLQSDADRFIREAVVGAI